MGLSFWSSEVPVGPVQYSSHGLCRVLFQRIGSVWPRVLPFCLANALLMFAITKLQESKAVNWGVNPQGHSFAGMIVSFLVVSRVGTAIARYNESLGNMATMYRECRELIFYISALTKSDQDDRARGWRNQVAYRTLAMLRTAVAVAEFDSHDIPSWEVLELSGMEREHCKPKASWRRYEMTRHSTRTDSMKVPHLMAFLVRESILSHDSQLAKPFPPPQEVKLLTAVENFMTGYYGMRRLMTAPVPFPLIQMTLTMVLSYVFTLPLVFLQDKSDMVLEHCVVVFLITYGFMGLELVSRELDDPFGHDANDFDARRFYKVVVEDVLMLIQFVDGQEWADKLRDRLTRRNENKSHSDERTSLV